MTLDPGRDIDQQRKTGGVGLGKAIAAKATDLVVQAFGKVFVVAPFPHMPLISFSRNTVRSPWDFHATMARRSWSASPAVKPAAAMASLITCSWKMGTPRVRSSTARTCSLG